MSRKKPFDFNKEYKGLPVKKRVGLIRVARNLLKQQKENNTLLADDSIPPYENEKEKSGIC